MFDHWHQILQQSFDLFDFFVKRTTSSVIAAVGAWILLRSMLRRAARPNRGPKPPAQI